MNNPTAPSRWTKDNAIILQQFLETGTGGLFIQQLGYSRPGLLAESSEISAVALRSQLVAGYEKAFNSILSLAVPVEDAAPVHDAYPDLDRPPEPGEDLTE